MDTNKCAIESAIGENEFLITLENALKSVEDKLRQFVKNVPTHLADSEFESGLRTIETEREKIRELLHSVVQPFLSSRKDETELGLQYKYEQMKNKLRNQTIELEKMINETQALKTQVLHDSF